MFSIGKGRPWENVSLPHSSAWSQRGACGSRGFSLSSVARCSVLFCWGVVGGSPAESQEFHLCLEVEKPPPLHSLPWCQWRPCREQKGGTHALPSQAGTSEGLMVSLNFCPTQQWRETLPTPRHPFTRTKAEPETRNSAPTGLQGITPLTPPEWCQRTLSKSSALVTQKI